MAISTQKFLDEVQRLPAHYALAFRVAMILNARHSYFFRSAVFFYLFQLENM